MLPSPRLPYLFLLPIAEVTTPNRVRLLPQSTETKFFEIPPCAGAVTCDTLLRMGQQLRQRAKRNRRKAYAKRVNARLLAAKKAK